MRPGTATAVSLLLALALLAPGPASAAIGHPEKKNPRMQVVKAFGSAETAGAVATATAHVRRPSGQIWDRGERSAAVSK